MKVHQDILDVQEAKLGDIEAKVGDLKAKLAKVEGPIKKLMDDKFTMQKKLDQPTLDKCTKFL